MNRNYIDTHLAVDRYLNGALSEDEAAEFEERLVWDQALMDEVDLAERLREGLRSALEETERGAAPGGGRGRLMAFLQVPAYAAAASFMLAVGLTSFVLTRDAPSGGASPAEVRLPTEIVPVFATRGTQAVPVTVSERAWTVLLVDAPPGYGGFRATVSRRDGTPVWTADGLSPTYPDSLAIGMPGSLLGNGEHVLTLDGVAPGASDYERIQQIPIDVTVIP